MGLHRINRASFGAWERSDATNELWEKLATLYPPTEKGVSLVPDEVEVENVKIDFVTGTVMCYKPVRDLVNVILHVRERVGGDLKKEYTERDYLDDDY